MRNILVVQLETKVSLAIIAVVVIIFLITLYKSVGSFNKFIDQLNIGERNEKIRIQENP